MAEFTPIWALGLMSGTSMDGVDGAMVLTDGVDILEFGESAFRPYSKLEMDAIAAAQGMWPGDDPAVLQAAATVVNTAHADMIGEFDQVDLVGFHGQTLAHDPDTGRTHQLGDGNLLAALTKRKTVWDFRTEDMVQGGQGAPLAPFFHFACAQRFASTTPVAFLNLGGVANVTWVDPRISAPEAPDALLAFDTGPANAPVNDLVKQRLGLDYDRNGELAAQGVVDESIIQRVYQREFFDRKPPKSLDRNDFANALHWVQDLCDTDAAATLTALAAACVAQAEVYLPNQPDNWLVCGGGRNNPVLMQALNQRLNGEAIPVEDIGLDGDMMEAQAFAYLAVRVLRGLPTSAPGTTGAARPVSGGQISG